MKPEERRKLLYEKYSLNFKLVRQFLPFKHIDEQLGAKQVKAVACPLCLEIFYSYAISSEEKNFLTIEHCPPKELGGSPKILLCKKCNSDTGHSLDVKLMEYYNVQPFNEQKEQSSVSLKSTMIESGDSSVKGTVQFKRLNDSTFEIDLLANDPYRKEKFDKVLKGETITITYKPHTTPSSHLIHTAILKIGYLLLFYKFGYRLILHDSYDLIRQQILNPTKRILPTKGVAMSTKLPVGFYLIKQPIFARGFLVVFELKFNDTIDRAGVFINFPMNPSVNFYSIMKVKEGANFKLDFETFIDLNFIGSVGDMDLFWEAINKPYKMDLKRLGLDFYH